MHSHATHNKAINSALPKKKLRCTPLVGSGYGWPLSKYVIVAMIIKKYDNFEMRCKKHFIFLGLLLICSQLGVYLASDFLMRNSYLIRYIVIFILAYGCLVFAMAFYRLYNVRCPICLGKTITKNSRKETPYCYSAYCSKCDVLWDLGVVNGD